MGRRAAALPSPTRGGFLRNACALLCHLEIPLLMHSSCSLTYYWNRKTGETTALGEPRPGPEGRLAAYRRATRQPLQPESRPGLGQLMAMGAGVGLVFALLSRLL